MKITTTTTLRIGISITIIIIKKKGIQKKDMTMSNVEKDYRRKAWKFLMIGTGS